MSSSSHLLHSPLAEKLQSPNNSTCDLNSTFQTESFAITILIYLYDILAAWDRYYYSYFTNRNTTGTRFRQGHAVSHNR